MVPYLNQAFKASLVTELCMDGWISQTRNKSCTQESQDSKTFTFKLYLSCLLSLSLATLFVLQMQRLHRRFETSWMGKNFHSFKFEIFWSCLKISQTPRSHGSPFRGQIGWVGSKMIQVRLHLLPSVFSLGMRIEILAKWKGALTKRVQK